MSEDPKDMSCVFLVDDDADIREMVARLPTDRRTLRWQVR